MIDAGHTKILSRVRALVERGERIDVDDIAELFAVSDASALAQIARIARERRFGRKAHFCDVRVSRIDAANLSSIVDGFVETESPVAIAPAGVRAGIELLLDAIERIGKARDITLVLDAPWVVAAAAAAGISIGDVIAQLHVVARVAITGVGAEIFDEDIRSRLASGSISRDDWIATHRAAHAIGIRTGAAMTYLTEHAPDAYARHLDELRTLQDETGGFAQFTSVPVHNRHADASYLSTPSAQQTLRITAITRIALDNIAHMATAPSLVTAEVSFVALNYGADTVDTMLSQSDVGLSEQSRTPTKFDGVDLPVISVRDQDPELDFVRSRIVEARFIPVALAADYSEASQHAGRMEA